MTTDEIKTDDEQVLALVAEYLRDRDAAILAAIQQCLLASQRELRESLSQLQQMLLQQIEGPTL